MHLWAKDNKIKIESTSTYKTINLIFLDKKRKDYKVL